MERENERAAGQREAFLAHVSEDGREHALLDHLLAVGALARDFASAFEGGGHAELAGCWHDLGKYAADFQAMLRAANASDAHLESDDDAKKRVDHSSAGALLAAQRDSANSLPIAFAIAGHHAGLADWRPKLVDRLKVPTRAPARLEAALSSQPPQEILSRQVPALPERLRPTDGARWRDLELFTRMLLSALCDADFLDTEAFFDSSRSALRGGHLGLDALLARLSAHLDSIARDDTEVNRARSDVRAACVAAASKPPGVFTMTVPTGGGKTLASMEFALRHALHHGLRRVVVAIPFTSIIEQNATAYREAFGLQDQDTSVLEHHSAVDPLRDASARARIAAENWDCPVVVTTNVQLLESLFARRPGPCRKLHNVARSVIVLDEAQTLPRGLLAPTTDVLEALVRDYGCSIVLCTATQPALLRATLRDCGFQSTVEIAPDPRGLAERLRRVDVDWSRTESQTPWRALAEELAAEADVLAIVHLRADARDLTSAVDACTGDTSTVHLSALMCPPHRSAVLASIRQRKKRGEAVRVVSTQLVEAGVDLDFPVVYRALGGLDAMAQAAGRCNREGRLARRGTLRVFRATTRPPRGILQQGLAVASATLAGGPVDLFDPDTHARYFQELYGLDTHDSKDVQEDRQALRFEQVASKYRIVEDDWAAPVVVPWDDRTRAAIRDVRRFGPSRERLRQLSRVSINVSKRDLSAWIASGSVEVLGDDLVRVLVDTGAYDDRFGLVPSRLGALSPEDSVI